MPADEILDALRDEQLIGDSRNLLRLAALLEVRIDTARYLCEHATEQSPAGGIIRLVLGQLSEGGQGGSRVGARQIGLGALIQLWGLGNQRTRGTER